MSVYAPAMSFIWQTIESYGLKPGPLFEAEGIRVRFPIDPHQRIPKEIVDRVRARAVEILGIETFGLKTAEVLAPPAWQAVKTYPVKWDDRTISVELPD